MQGQLMDEHRVEPSGPREGGDPADPFTRHLRAAPTSRAEAVERARRLLRGRAGAGAGAGAGVGVGPSDDDIAAVLAGWLVHTHGR
ncbi:MAG: hypothetical protein IPM45_15210 [Acidimicrobiales bacterium]|nr:hypothetical protein [Acidimicrobiales bacterium]